METKSSDLQSSKKLSLADQESLNNIEILLKETKDGNQQAGLFLLRKITNILEDHSANRNIILECNDFLIQLEEILEIKLGNK